MFPERFRPSVTKMDQLQVSNSLSTQFWILIWIVLSYMTRIWKHLKDKCAQLYSGYSRFISQRQGTLSTTGNQPHCERRQWTITSKGCGRLQFYCCMFFILVNLLQESEAVQQNNGELYKVDNAMPDHSVVPLINKNNNMDVQFDHAGVPLAGGNNQSDWPDVFESTTSAGKEANPNDATMSALKFWINSVLTNIIVILGLIGNSLTIIILTRRAMRSSTNIYLSALAVWDIVVLICTALLIGLDLPEFVWYRHCVYAYVVSYAYPLALIAQTATIWLTVSFTVERYIAVCHPLKAARMCTIKRAKVVIYGVSIGATLYNMPRWFEYKAIQYDNPELGNLSITIVSQTSFVQNPWYTQIYFSWLYVPIMCIIPLATLSILNTCLVMAVRRSQKQRKDMNVRQSRENNVTIMLASVVVVFILCQVPALVYNLAYAIDREYVENESFGYGVLSVMRNYLVTFNSAINFLLYCALGQKFRRIFLHTFCKKCINDTYMPMSGIHQHTSQFQINPHKGARQYYANNHAMMVVRKKGLTDGHTTSSSTTQTTLGTNSSQESALIDPGTSPRHHASDGREVRTYTAPRVNKKRVSSPGHVGPMSSSVPDSDTEGYDVALEHLLTSSDKSDASLTAGYQQHHRSKLYGIKNTVAVQ